MGRANEMSGLGCELMQFFKLSHRVLQRNELRYNLTIDLPNTKLRDQSRVGPVAKS
jgi:hypothetical protein